MLAELFQGERDAADVFLLISVILFGFAVIAHFVTGPLARHASTLLAVGLGCLAFGLLLQ